jgi:hypothetical protein
LGNEALQTGIPPLEMIAPGEWECNEDPKKLPVPKDEVARQWLEDQKQKDPFWYLPEKNELLWMKL